MSVFLIKEKNLSVHLTEGDLLGVLEPVRLGTVTQENDWTHLKPGVAGQRGGGASGTEEKKHLPPIS